MTLASGASAYPSISLVFINRSRTVLIIYYNNPTTTRSRDGITMLSYYMIIVYRYHDLNYNYNNDDNNNL